jgi:FkbH-like protein
VAADEHRVALYGRLMDTFGDNGVVSVVIGRVDGEILHIELWLMSCRVLKRDMEFAMMDELVRAARARGIAQVKGYYFPTPKNGMVRDFYSRQGFAKDSEDESGNAVWTLKLADDRRKQNVIDVIKIREAKG